MIHVRPSIEADVIILGPKLRKDDLQELKASHGLDGVGGLGACYFVSDRCYTVVIDGSPEAMFGVSRVTPEIGSIWLMSSPAFIKKGKRALVKDTQKWIDELSKGYELICNFVDARNTVHIKWLQRIGFLFSELYEEYGYERRPFYFFSKQCVLTKQQQ